MREVDNNTGNMAERVVTVIKRDEVKPPVHEDLLRLAKSMRTVLRHRYRNPLERKAIAVRIMAEISLDQPQDVV